MVKDFYITKKNVYSHIEHISEFIKQYVENANRKGVVIGMSGGLDCAVVAAICHHANIPTTLLMLPDGRGMEDSDDMNHALEFANKFKLPYEIINIKEVSNDMDALLGENMNKLSQSNIRPRVRMTLLYSYAQAHSAFVMGTSNLNERLFGYFTKWGDGASDLDPLGNLTKHEVRLLAEHLGVPHSIIDKAPSAGLIGYPTDEEDLGFTYAQMEDFIIKGSSGNHEADKKMNWRVEISAHKVNPIPMYEGYKEG